MDDAELTVRVIAASSPPAVDDLTTFLRKRITEDRSTLDGAQGIPAARRPTQGRREYENCVSHLIPKP